MTNALSGRVVSNAPTTNVVENGVTHSYVVNPCGEGVGKDACFRIQVLPNDYPDEKIVWSNETAGAVYFVGGNAGWVVATASGGEVWPLMRFKNVFDARQMG